MRGACSCVLPTSREPGPVSHRSGPGAAHSPPGGGAGFGPVPLGAIRASRTGAVAFIHRFGALLNGHVRFHCAFVVGLSSRMLQAARTSTKGGASVPKPSPALRPRSVSFSCVRSPGVDCAIAKTRRRWAPWIAVGVSRSMRASVSRRTTVRAWGAGCDTVPVRPSRWNDQVKSLRSTWSMRASNRIRAASSR